MTLAILAGLFAAIYKAQESRFENETVEQSRGRVEIMRAQMDATLDKIAVALNSAEFYYHEQLRDNGKINPRKMNGLLVVQRQQIREFSHVRILDAAGTVRFSSEALPPASVNIADLAFYETHRTNPDPGLLISGPLFGRISQKWLLVFSRRLDGLDGTFAGVVYGSIELGEFEKIFALKQSASADVVALRRFNGEAIWRFPRGANRSATIPSDSVAIQQRVRENQDGQFRAVSPVDGIERLYVFSRLHSYPAYMLLGRSTQNLHEIFLRNIEIQALLAALLAAVLLLLLQTIYRRIHAQHKVTAAIEKSERRLAYALDASTEGVWDWNLETDNCYCSPRYFEILGHEPRPTSTVNTLLDFFHPEDRIDLLPRLRRALQVDGHYDIEFRMLAADGQYKWIMSRGKVVERDAEGKPTRAVGTHTDITSRKVAQLEMQEARWKIEERNRQVETLNTALATRALEAEASVRTKELFLANIGHELRTPLTPIIGFVDLILQKASDPTQINWLQTIRNSAEHLLHIINDMLDITIIESGKIKIDDIDFDLDAVLQDIRAMMDERIRAKGLAFDIRTSPDVPPRVRGDPRRLTQIILNLVSNAVKFTEEGSVTLKISRQPADHGAQRLLFEVEDTGIGISPEIQPKLFSNFVQADDSFRRKYGGLGLGLSISRQLVTLMHGEIGCRSTPKAGSTFWFTARFGADGAGED